MQTIAWILGEGGLLGQSVRHAILRDPRAEIWARQLPRFTWTDRTAVRAQLQQALASFLAASRQNSGWCIYWCAGAGVLRTAPFQLELESSIFKDFLHDLKTLLPRGHGGPPGHVAFASSAAVFGEELSEVVSESTPSRAPVSEYGLQKLQQENLLKAWAEAASGMSCTIGRFTTLYGPGQSLTKPQGVISQLCRSALFRSPLRLYVPLDTQHDFLFSADAGQQLVDCVSFQLDCKIRNATKIVCSGQSVALGSIVSHVSRVSGQRIRIILQPLKELAGSPPKFRFRSECLQEAHLQPPTPVAVGIHAVWREQLKLFRTGKLPAPSPISVLEDAKGR